MAIDEKIAILRGLNATAQEVRDQAAAPEVVARAQALRRAADARYRAFSCLLMLLPLALALLAVGTQEFRMYSFGLRWGSNITPQDYFHEAFLLIAAGLVLCGAGFGIFYAFVGSSTRLIRITAITTSILAAVVPVGGAFSLHPSFVAGRHRALAQLDYSQLAAAAPQMMALRNRIGVAGGTAISESDPQWADVPQYARDLHAPLVYLLDRGFALELDSPGPFKEGLLIGADAASAAQLAQKYGMDLIHRDPPVLHFIDLREDGSWLNDALSGKADAPSTPGL